MVRSAGRPARQRVGPAGRDAVKRGDIGGISFRMGHVIERWERRLADGYDGRSATSTRSSSGAR
jgi:hypothetical protein